MTRRLLLLLGALSLALPGSALADGMLLPGPDPAMFALPPLSATRSQEAVPGPPTEQQAELTIEERRAIQERLKVRRALAEAHQVMSFTTAGLIIAAEVIGVINLAALENGDPRYAELKPSLGIHRVLAGAAVGTYWTTGALAWAMPPAYNANLGSMPGKKKKADSGDIHAALSIAHGIGMGFMLVSGVLMANVADNKAWKPLVVGHTAVGFTTAALVIGSGIVINTL